MTQMSEKLQLVAALPRVLQDAASSNNRFAPTGPYFFPASNRFSGKVNSAWLPPFHGISN
jgi:hypothetical protein